MTKLPAKWRRQDLVNISQRRKDQRAGPGDDFFRAADPYYDPIFCEFIIGFAERQMFPEEWAAELGLSEATVFEWVDKFPEFAEAWEIAITKLRAAFTRDMRDASQGKVAFAQGALYQVFAKKRFPDLYGDSKDAAPVSKTGPSEKRGSEIEAEKSSEIEQMQTEELLRELEILRKRQSLD